MEVEDVLFIDHTEIYENEFVQHNLLSMNTSVEYKKSPFSPMENIIFHLITGITTNRVLFYSITSRKMQLYSYID
jgi:hypothetical protein